MKAQNTARLGMRSSSKRSSYAATSSAWRRNGAQLPPGGEIPQDFEFVSEYGPVRLSSLFGDKNTLMVYSMMYGPQRKTPCPMCTSFLTFMEWNRRQPS